MGNIFSNPGHQSKEYKVEKTPSSSFCLQSQIKVILKNGPDLNLKDNDGNNEMEIALDMKKMKALKLIAYHMST